jgi:type II secretory pathway pseudopilin PulG
MKLAHNFRQRTDRPAFTLVELLVVIAIIIVLVSMLMVGVFKALDTAYEAQTRTDITQLAAAVQSFETKYQINYIPSRLVLCKEWLHYYSAPGVFKSQLHQDSFEYLGRVWPRLDWNTPQPWPAIPPWPLTSASPTGAGGIDWDNTGSPFLTVRDASNNAINANQIILEGEQCLVFFLGGIQPLQYVPGSSPPVLVTPATDNGFSTNQSNPAQFGGDRVPPFFEFKSNRLVSLSQLVFSLGGSPLGLNDFFVYKDGYGKTPYAYFSSYKNGNGYNRYFLLAGNSDCQTLGVWPYAQSWAPSPVYYNAQTFQIISAGKDYTFGPGTSPAVGNTWAPSYAGQVYTQGQAGGYDDIANFYDRLLGVPTQ